MHRSFYKTPPDGVDLSAVSSLRLGDQATLPSGVDLSAVSILELWDQATLPALVILPKCKIPIIKEIDRAILNALDGGGTINMGDWHTCITTHCRAGWAIHLSGDDGYALEKKFDSHTAGALIYAASRPDLPTPNFMATNEEAMADLKACAGKR